MSEVEENAIAARLFSDLFRRKIAVAQVPPDAIPRLHLDLESAKQKFITGGYVDKVQRIHKIQQELAAQEHRRASGARSANRLPPLRRTPQTPDPAADSLGALLDSMADGAPLDHGRAAHAPALIALARARVDALIAAQRYDRAQDYENALRALLVIADERSAEGRRLAKRARLAANLARAQADLADAEARRAAALAGCDGDAARARARLREEQDQQLAALDEETALGVAAIAGCTASPQLLFLQRQAAALLATKRYEEADSAIRVAKAREELETDAQRKRFAEARAVRRAHALEDFRQALAAFDEKTARNRLRREQELTLDVEGKQRAVANLQGRLAEMDAILEAEAARATTVRTPPLVDKKVKGSPPRAEAERTAASTETEKGYQSRGS
jgi:hypothetical protein